MSASHGGRAGVRWRIPARCRCCPAAAVARPGRSRGDGGLPACGGWRWCLLAFDRDRVDWRSLRLDRISALQARGTTFVARQAPDAAAHVSRSMKSVGSVMPQEGSATARSPRDRGGLTQCMQAQPQKQQSAVSLPTDRKRIAPGRLGSVFVHNAYHCGIGSPLRHMACITSHMNCCRTVTER